MSEVLPRVGGWEDTLDFSLLPPPPPSTVHTMSSKSSGDCLVFMLDCEVYIVYSSSSKSSCVHGREGGKTRAAASCGSFRLLLSFITSSLRFSLFALSQHPIFLLRIQACVKRQNERGVRTLEGRPNEIFYECIKYWLLDLDLPSMHRPFFYNKIETPEKGSSRDEPPFVVLSKYYFKLPT